MNELQHKSSSEGKVLVSGREAAAGLVPYTTSDTSPIGASVSALDGLQSLVLCSASEARLRRMKHHVRTAGRLISETMARDGGKYRALFVTLTYRSGVSWSPRHITGFIKNLRMWSSRLGYKVGYLWVAEVQKRGAVHYHAVVWIPRHLHLPRPDGKRQWWPYGDSNVQAVKRNAVGYLMKYVSKGVGDYPDLPRGARVCASGGLDAMARDEFHFWRLPRYVREHLQIGDRCRRQVGGGWFCPRTGESWRSDWGLFGIAFVKRSDDCNGRKRSPDSVTMLSNQFKRVGGQPIVVDPDVVAEYQLRVREDAFETVRTDIITLACRYGWSEQL